MAYSAYQGNLFSNYLIDGFGEIGAISDQYIEIDSYDANKIYKYSVKLFGMYATSSETFLISSISLFRGSESVIIQVVNQSIAISRDAEKINLSDLWGEVVRGNDLFSLGDESDVIFLGRGDDYVIASGGDDYVTLGQGDDYLDAGSGMDISIYEGDLKDYHIERSGNSMIVKDLGSNNEGIDTLANVERLQFFDYSVALDTDSANSAGGIYRLYQAAFDRQPDLPGLGYWIKAADNGKSAVTMAEDFTWSSEFQSVYNVRITDNYASGSNVQNLVKGFYNNVLGRDPDAGGLNYYTGVIQSHEKTVGRVLAEISDSPENHILVASAIANGIQYTPYTAQAMTSLYVIDNVDGVVAEPQTMALDSYSTYSDQYQVDLIGQTHDPMLDWMWMG